MGVGVTENDHPERGETSGSDVLSRSIVGVQGVRNHSLRTRRTGPYCLVDVTIVVDARISASAASMIAETVHDHVIREFAPFVTDVHVHVDFDSIKHSLTVIPPNPTENVDFEHQNQNTIV